MQPIPNLHNKLLILAITVIAVAIIVSVYLLCVQEIGNKNLQNQVLSTNQSNEELDTKVHIEDSNIKAGTVEESVDTSNWQTYRNEEAGFEFKYPKEWSTRDIKPYRSTRYIMEEEFLVLDPVVSFLSPKELEIINSPNYTDQPVGFFITVRKVNDISLEKWTKQYYDGNQPWYDGPVTHMDTKFHSIHNTYSANVSGLGDGIYSTHIELNNGYLLTVDTPLRGYHEGDILKGVISTLIVY
ncbi:hypothetical protein [Allomesorhizobium camelthorni]|uniref:Uncharacterized protein n=1 Tax=Allomesorhizobium camelthorni TaxID=475069 RepID=A0A6G4WFF9_9HYPH|nr:hypothetical protein [Mesorhizobium camelthorni]NGO53491.1 hypothetical protein [Mesorhizobium camelthorni]